jgi:hypothetical protein
MMAGSKRYDLALVMSQDTDLLEPIRLVTEELGLLVGLIWLDGRDANGTNISKPATW